MFATELALENFKRFENVSIDLQSRITLLIGPNSSGKSSILKALLGLKQTASPSNQHEVFSAQGDYVDLGIYRDYVLEHDINERIRLSLTTSVDVFPFSIEDGRALRFTLCFGYDPGTEQARLFEIVICDVSANEPLIRVVKKQTRDSFLLTLSDSFARELLPRLVGRKIPPADERKIVSGWTKGLPVRVDDRYQFSWDEAVHRKEDKALYVIDFPIRATANLINSLFRGLDTDFFYLGPLRRSPSRSYSRTAHLLSVGPSGEHTPSVLANLKARASRERSKERLQAKRLDQLTKWISNIFPGRSVNAKTIEELVKLEISREGGGREVITDVGFGFSQILPILVQIAVMPDGSTLLIEQPELHLHPSAQSKLAEVVVDASNSGRRFVVETHSEHFVRGLQLAVSNKTAKKSTSLPKLSATDLKFIYVPRAPEPPQYMTVDDWGEFNEPWPSGFFDEAYASAMKLLQNKIDAKHRSADAALSGKSSETRSGQPR